MFGKLKDKLKLWIGKVSEENETFTETKRPLEKIKETSKKKEKVKPIEEHIYVQPEKKIFDEEERKVGDRISEDINEEKNEERNSTAISFRGIPSSLNSRILSTINLD